MHMHFFMPEGSSIPPCNQTYRASKIQLLKVVWCSLFQTVNAGCVVVVMLYPLSHIICLACKGRSAKDSECSIHTYNVFQVDVHGGMGPVDSAMEMSQTHAYRCIDLFFEAQCAPVSAQTCVAAWVGYRRACNYRWLQRVQFSGSGFMDMLQVQHKSCLGSCDSAFVFCLGGFFWWSRAEVACPRGREFMAARAVRSFAAGFTA